MLRVNYSLLKLVDDGRLEEAIDYYHGKSMKPTQAMQSGSYFHKLWEDEMRETGKFPKIFADRKLENPQIEVRLERELLPWLILHGKPDLAEDITISDWKTGTTEATTYASGKQHKVYQLLLPDKKYFDYWAYNQYVRQVSMQRVHLTPQTLDEGLDWVITNATAFKELLAEMGEEI
jgi:hypothetical protein